MLRLFSPCFTRLKLAARRLGSAGRLPVGAQQAWRQQARITDCRIVVAASSLPAEEWMQRLWSVVQNLGCCL